MTRPWTERELKRMSRQIAGHARDKDRARRKRRRTGAAPGRSAKPRPQVPEDEEPLVEDEVPEGDDAFEAAKVKPVRE
jgi:hypothetical protein